MSGYLSGRAAPAGVMGWPVGHSLSPRLHAFWLRQHRQGPAFAPGSGFDPEVTDALRTTVLAGLG